MKTTINEEEGKIVATFEGRLDTAAAVICAKEVEPLNNTDKDVILDCSGLSYISSSGLRIFLNIRKNAATKGNKVTVMHINDDIRKVFQMTGFMSLFEIV